MRMVLIFVVMVSGLFAENVYVKSSFKNKIPQMFFQLNNDDMREYFRIFDRMAIRLTWRDKYGDRGMKAKSFLKEYGVVARTHWGERIDDTTGKYVSVASQAEVDYAYYQCVGFVKAVTNMGSRYISRTSNWVPLSRLSPNNLPPKYTPIATFKDTTGDGNANRYVGHVAIFYSGNSEGIWVIDQNWSDTSGGYDPVGSIAFHFIPFNENIKSVRRPRTTNASNYYTFKLGD